MKREQIGNFQPIFENTNLWENIFSKIQPLIYFLIFLEILNF